MLILNPSVSDTEIEDEGAPEGYVYSFYSDDEYTDDTYEDGYHIEGEENDDEDDEEDEDDAWLEDDGEIF